MKFQFLVFTFSFMIFIAACNDMRENKSLAGGRKNDNTKSANGNRISFQNETGKSVFYGLYSPNDISKMLNRGGMRYMPEAFLPVSSASRFTSSSKIAINLGVYGADFSIAKMYDDPEEAIKYMGAISELSGKLGIPAGFLEASAERIEQNIGNIDSLSNIAMEVFSISTEFLLETGRESALSLVLMGGWIEGMYQALNILNTDSVPDPQMVELIVEQKYALNYLLTFLKNQYEDPDVAYYYRLLEILASRFEDTEIYYRPGEVEVDTSMQLIKTNWSRFDYSVLAIDEIKQIVDSIREIATEA